MVDRAGFEPTKAEPCDLESHPFDRSGNDPHLNKKIKLDNNSGFHK